MIETYERMPLGSVVSLKGNPKKLMVIARVPIADDDGREYYDYGFCLYPEGLLGDTVIYSNHDQIEAVHFIGFSDEEDEEILRQTEETLKELDIRKAQPSVMGEW